jgi:hypothetical protein
VGRRSAPSLRRAPVAMALEQSSGALVYQLSQYPHLWLYPVHPATAAHYRRVFYPSGSKSDPADTGLLLELVVHHRDRLRQLAPDTPDTRLLRMLVEQRRQLVDEKTRWNNRLKAALKMYFPQVLDWVDIDTMMGCALLERWSTLRNCSTPRELCASSSASITAAPSHSLPSASRPSIRPRRR